MTTSLTSSTPATRPARTPSRTLPYWLAALLAAQGVWTLQQGTPTQDSLWVSDGLFLGLEGVACLLVWRLWFSQRQTTYLLFALAFLCQLGADAYYISLELRGLDYPDFSVADPLYLGFYVGAALGLLKVLQGQVARNQQLGRLLDSLIITSTAGITLWQGFLSRTLSASMSLSDWFNLVYVLLDLLILSLSLLLLHKRSGGRGEGLLSGGLVFFAAADIVYMAQAETYQPGQWLDVLWSLALALQAVALWQMSHEPRPAAGAARPASSWLWPSKTEALLQPLPYIAVLVACFVLTHTPLEHSVRSLGVIWGTVLVMVFSTLRQWVTARENAKMTHELKNQRTQLERLAYHDNLTGLKNRAAFNWLFEHHLSSSQPYAIFSLDLNGFKYINDTHGHGAGDDMLRHVARQLGRVTHRPTHIFRWGGDEFVLVALNIVTAAQAEQLAAEVTEVVQTPLLWNNQVVLSVGTSVGYALGRGTGNAEMLLSLADSGMYRVKQRQGQQR